MALVFADRVKETTTTTGTGTVTLAGAASGFQSFAAIGDGNTTYYTISGGAEWEVGVGTYTASGTTLSRTTVLASSNAGSLVTFSAGSKEVICTYPAEKVVIQDASGGVSVSTGAFNVVGSNGTFQINTAGDQAAFTYNGYNYLTASGAAATLQVQASGASGKITFATAGSEQMRVHSSGGVSIGTTTDPGAKNVTANSFQDGYTTTATAAGTTTLTVASTGMQYFTGTTTQTLVLPVTSTLQLGWSYHVANTSTGIVTVQSSGANVIVAIPPGLSVMFTCILTSGTTAASWDYGFTDFPAATPLGAAAIGNQMFRIPSNLATIGPTIADFFGTTSTITLPAAGVYEVEFEIYFTKVTAGTVTFTLTSSNAPVNINAYWIGTPLAGVGTAGSAQTAAVTTSASAALALPVTGSLSAVGHHYTIKATVESHATLDSTFKLRVTSSAGTVTPLRGSNYQVRPLTAGNSGSFS